MSLVIRATQRVMSTSYSPEMTVLTLTSVTYTVIMKEMKKDGRKRAEVEEETINSENVSSIG